MEEGGEEATHNIPSLLSLSPLALPHPHHQGWDGEAAEPIVKELEEGGEEATHNIPSLLSLSPLALPHPHHQGLDGEAAEPIVKELEEGGEEATNPEKEFAAAAALVPVSSDGERTRRLKSEQQERSVANGADGKESEPMAPGDGARGEEGSEIGSPDGLLLLLRLLEEVADEELASGEDDVADLLKLLHTACLLRTNRVHLLRSHALPRLLDRATRAALYAHGVATSAPGGGAAGVAAAAVAASQASLAGSAEVAADTLLRIVDLLMVEGGEGSGMGGESGVGSATAEKEEYSHDEKHEGSGRGEEAVRVFLEKLTAASLSQAASGVGLSGPGAFTAGGAGGGGGVGGAGGGAGGGKKRKRDFSESVARILPYMTYGEGRAMGVLVDHFRPLLLDWAGFDRLVGELRGVGKEGEGLEVVTERGGGEGGRGESAGKEEEEGKRGEEVGKEGQGSGGGGEGGSGKEESEEESEEERRRKAVHWWQMAGHFERLVGAIRLDGSGLRLRALILERGIPQVSAFEFELLITHTLPSFATCASPLFPTLSRPSPPCLPLPTAAVHHLLASFPPSALSPSSDLSDLRPLPAWQRVLALPSLPLLLGLLLGLCRGHPPTQRVLLGTGVRDRVEMGGEEGLEPGGEMGVGGEVKGVEGAEKGVLPLLLLLEGVVGYDGLGARAEALLEVLSGGEKSGEVGERGGGGEQLEGGKEEGRGGGERGVDEESMGVKSQLAPTGAHRIMLTSAKPSVSGEGSASAGPTSAVGAGRSRDEEEEEEEEEEERKEKGEEGEEEEEEEEACGADASAAAALLSTAFPFNDAQGLLLSRLIALPPAMRALRCMVCHEGYRLRPNELIGAYTFSRRFSDLSTWSLTSTTSRVAVNWSISTVSHFNTIHFSCHDRAKRADSALKLPKREWDGAALRNGGTLCNALFPLRGPQVSPAVYARRLDSWWESVASLGHVDGSRFLILLRDLRTLLARFVLAASFSTDCHGGGRESNARFLPFQLHMLLHLSSSASSSQRHSLDSSLSALLDLASQLHSRLPSALSSIFPRSSPSSCDSPSRHPPSSSSPSRFSPLSSSPLQSSPLASSPLQSSILLSSSPSASTSSPRSSSPSASSLHLPRSSLSTATVAGGMGGSVCDAMLATVLTWPLHRWQRSRHLFLLLAVHEAARAHVPSASAGPSDVSRVSSTVAGKAVAAVLAAVQVLAPLSAAFVPLLAQPPPAEAILLSPDTKVPRNADVALRRAVPVVNEAVRKIQDELEEISTLMRIPQKKPYKTMQANVNKAVKLAEANQVAILDAVPAADRERAAAIYNDLVNSKSGFPGLLAAIEDKDPDRVSIRLASSLNDVANLSLLQATGLQFLIPNQYATLPRLTGRATVEFAVLKADGSYFSLDNGATSALTGVLQVVLDGYSAPLTAGNFAQLVSRRAYDGVAVKATDLAVLSDARYPSAGRDVPLEIMPAGEFQPIYRTPLDVQDGELPVLPMSVFGAMVMAHSPESDSFSHPSQFFLYKYDKRRSGLGGLAFDEGQFSVFGYVTRGRDVLAQLRTGDVIQSARIVAGADRLSVPSV
ncbi:unnamed protein product [Closterium sp. Naga37s-1]|nr:unnamed protein product [Closterium sp. Naga37s-1]